MLFICTTHKLDTVPNEFKSNSFSIKSVTSDFLVLRLLMKEYLRLLVRNGDRPILFWGCPQKRSLIIVLKLMHRFGKIVIVEPYVKRELDGLKTLLNYQPVYLKVLQKQIMTTDEFWDSYGQSEDERVTCYVDVLILRNLNNLSQTKNTGLIDEIVNYHQQRDSRTVIKIKDHPFYLGQDGAYTDLTIEEMEIVPVNFDKTIVYHEKTNAKFYGNIELVDYTERLK